ncbi:MAG TPA: TIGR02996 domain-containing protein [Xanthomonadales bacterium]|nr:TIGR02996 domain-containing protein [Xanthomonadales bacterium]
MARYEKTEGEGKFWEITQKGRVITTRAGKIGAGASRDRDGVLYLYDRRGRTNERAFLDEAAARTHYDKCVATKLKAGYKLVDGIDAPSAAPTPIEIHINAELEAAIAAAPDDIASYLVYADWLIARGDPRGELITLQHGMRAQSDPAKFMTFKKQEEALRTAHLRSWLGDVAGPCLHRLKIDWRAGHFEGVRIDGPDNMTETPLPDLVDAVLGCPLARFVRRLEIRGTAADVADAVPETPPPTLAKLVLHLDGWNVGSMRDERARIEAECARYRDLGIDASTRRWDADEGAPRRDGGRYNGIRE